MKFKKLVTIFALSSSLILSGVIVINNSNSQNVQAAKKHKKTKYVSSKIKLPAGYTRKELLKAYLGKANAKFIKASMKGMQDNNFSRTSAAEKVKDNKRKVNPAKLTASQRKELAKYALKLINGPRKQLKLKPWVYSKGTEKLAIDIASEYQKNGRSIRDGQHYVPGIIKACKKNGLNLDDNYVEDMAGFNSKYKTFTITKMKKNIYFGIKQMIFGYAGSGESGRHKKSNYREWQHAGDLFNTQGSKHDGDHNYFGFSISKTGRVYSMHFISVPTYAVKNPQYNQCFKP